MTILIILFVLVLLAAAGRLIVRFWPLLLVLWVGCLMWWGIISAVRWVS